jgi:hypothetical protein
MQTPISILVLQIRFEIVVFVIVLFKVGRIVDFTLTRAGDLSAATRLGRRSGTFSAFARFGVGFLLLVVLLMSMSMAMRAAFSCLASLSQRSPITFIGIKHLLTTTLLNFQLVDVFVQKPQARDHAQS